MQNGFVESFNGKLRDECLNEHLFLSYNHARKLIEQWRNDYNYNRPHSSLKGLTPVEFTKLQDYTNQLTVKLGINTGQGHQRFQSRIYKNDYPNECFKNFVYIKLVVPHIMLFLCYEFSTLCATEDLAGFLKIQYKQRCNMLSE